MDRYKERLSSPKKIYLYPLRSDFRNFLCGERDDYGDHAGDSNYNRKEDQIYQKLLPDLLSN
jgi:hypothetical protein